MEVHFTPELQAILDDMYFREKVTASLAKLDNGEFFTHEEVGARLDKLFQP
jgi:predicted transcriptional regulator